MKCSRVKVVCEVLRSLPVRGAWIEMKTQKSFALTRWSLPVRGAWIEIRSPAPGRKRRWSLPVRGAWIEMERSRRVVAHPDGRSPCGERGLKFFSAVHNFELHHVAPRAGSVD